MLIWTSKSNLCTVYARFGRYKGVYALWWPDGQMGDKLTRSTFYRHYLLQKGEGKPSLPSSTTPKQSVLYRCPRYLRQTLRKLWLCGQRVLDGLIFPNIPNFISSLNHFVADWSVHKAQFTTLETRRKLDRVNFRKDFWDRKNWPIADQRVPSYDPTNNCGTHFGYSFLLLTQVANN